MKGIQLINYDLDVHVQRVDEEYINGKGETETRNVIASGLVLGDILAQNQAIILHAQKGELKQAPTLGCGISDMLLDHDPTLWKREIRENMETDGQKVSDIRVTTSSVSIDATYGS